MVYQLHKHCVKLKISLYEEPIALVSPLEVMAAVGMLYQSFEVPLPERTETIKELIKKTLEDLSGRPAPDEDSGKILKLVEEFQTDSGITDDFWQTLLCGYDRNS